MGIDLNKYSSVEEQKAILENNLRAWASDYYAHQINIKIQEGAGNQEAVDATRAAMATIDQSADVAQAELATLDTVPSV